MNSRIESALAEALGALWTEPEDDRDLADWRALPGKLLAALKAARIAVVELPEPYSRVAEPEWNDGDVWACPGFGRVRIYVHDSRFEAGDARDFAAGILAAADASEGL